MDTTQTILRSVRHFFAGTILSRFSGLLRDMTMAICFGAQPEIASFMVAYRFANLLRRLFGEGNLQSGFVPHFETLRKRSEKAAFCFYRDAVYSLSTILFFIILGMEIALWWSVKFLPADWREIGELTMWMAPGLLFICLSALNASLLQCQKKYFASAIAPVLFNVVWMICAFVSARLVLSEAVHFLSMGITFAFAVQWGVTAMRVRKEVRAHLGWKERIRPCLFSLEWRNIVKPMTFGIAGVGAMQINSALDALFARIADLSGPIYLWYSIRVQQLPLALFGIALSGALLPPLSRAMSEGNADRYRELLSHSMRWAATFMISCCFALFVLGASGLNILYGRGQFSSADLQKTLYCLWAYSLGLVPTAFVLLLAAGSYAKKTYGLPALSSLISVGTSAVLNAIFVFGFHWGAISVALSTSASAWLNFAILLRGTVIEPGFWKHFMKVTLAASMAAALSLYCSQWLGDVTTKITQGDPLLFPRSFSQQAIQFFTMGSLFLGSLLALARALRLEGVYTPPKYCEK